MATNTHPFSPEMKQCPYPHYDDWRDDSPLVWSDEVKAWLLAPAAECESRRKPRHKKLLEELTELAKKEPAAFAQLLAAAKV